jgi:diketogulonate reductase-like aldo/keto reductase
MQIGYGTGTAWYKRDSTKAVDRALVEGIKLAIKLGFYHLDCAEG